MWKDQANHLGARTVAQQLGLDACPVCDHRPDYARRDRMGSVQWRDLGRWHCYACDAGGDAVALIAAVACGSTRPVTPEGWREAERLAAGLGLTSGPARPVVRRPRYPLPDDGSARWLAVDRMARRLADAWAEYVHELPRLHKPWAWEHIWTSDFDYIEVEAERVREATWRR